MNNEYQPGLHLLIEIRNADRLTDLNAWLALIHGEIRKHTLTELGSVSHIFPETGAFTAVHCLTESHISIHTWPEFKTCTCDVFLSNFKRDNSEKVRSIGKAILEHFGSNDCTINEQRR